MFEKFSALDVDSAGRGGEYTVQVCKCVRTRVQGLKPPQAGFGWTNGVVLWIAETYGKQLNDPDCPSLLATSQGQNSTSSGSHNAMPFSGALVAMTIGVLMVL